MVLQQNVTAGYFALRGSKTYMAYKKFLSIILIGAISLGGFSASIRAAETQIIQIQPQKARTSHYYIYFNNSIDEKIIKKIGGKVVQKLIKHKAAHVLLTSVQAKKLQKLKAIRQIKLDDQFENPLDTPIIRTQAIGDQMLLKRYNIIFKDQIDLKGIEGLRGEVKAISKSIKLVTAYLTPKAAEVLKKNTNVKLVVEDQILKIQEQEQDWGIDKTRTPKAWAAGYSGKGIKIAVIDTGIAPHSDLKVAGGINKVYDDISSYKDDDGHGTHVAGIIAAQNNTEGVVGVANEAELYAVKALHKGGWGFIPDIVGGIDWAIDHDMDIINMSLGIDASKNPRKQKIMDEALEPLKMAVDNAWKHGIFVVAAVGNASSEKSRAPVAYPARFPNAIAVSAINQDYGLSWFSNAGAQVDFAAPGRNIKSTFLNNIYHVESGTSMAAPYVAGIIALYKQAYPKSTPAQILELMKENARDLGKAGKDDLFGYGLVQAPIGNPQAPTLQCIENVNKGVKLKWNAVEKAASYILKRNGAVIYQGSSLEYIDTKYTLNQVNKYEIKAVNSIGSSAASLKSIYSLKAYLPTVLKITHSISKNNLNYKWNQESKTRYYVVSNKKTYSLGSKNSFTLYNVEQGKTYSIALYAQNFFGKSKVITKTVTVPYTLPTSPMVSSVKATKKQVTLTWQPVKNAKSYIVKKGNIVIYKGTASNVIDKKIIKNKTYNYTIYAVNPKGMSKGKNVKVKIPKK